MIIPSNVTNIGSSVFSGCTNLEKITVHTQNKSRLDFIHYSYNKELNVIVPEGTKRIGSSAFSYCRNLTSITIPQSVTFMNRDAFAGCGKLKKITVYTTKIDADFLKRSYYKGKVHVIIPKGTTHILSEAFYRCSFPMEVTISDSVKDIGHHAFAECDGLINITLPDSITNIGDYAFYKCKNLEKINIPNGVTKIGNRAFYGCRKLKNIEIPKNTKLGSYTFSLSIKPTYK